MTLTCEQSLRGRFYNGGTALQSEPSWLISGATLSFGGSSTTVNVLISWQCNKTSRSKFWIGCDQNFRVNRKNMSPIITPKTAKRTISISKDAITGTNALQRG